MSLLGGFDSGRNEHRAGAPTLIPVPSLLRSLLSEHLDPGYAAAARDGRPRRRGAEWAWQLLAAVAIATVFVLAWSQARATAPQAKQNHAQDLKKKLPGVLSLQTLDSGGRP